MVFTPKNWQFNDIITEGELNRMEQGIADAHQIGEQAQAVADTANQKADQNNAAIAAHLNESVTDTGGAHGLKIEQGTWTPTLFGTTTAGNPTYASRSGTYYKIGKQVFITGHISLSSKGGMAGSIRIGGLPFIPSVERGVFTVGFASNLSLSKPFLSGHPRTYGVIDLNSIDQNGALVVLESHITDSTHIEFSAIYVA